MHQQFITDKETPRIFDFIAYVFYPCLHPLNAALNPICHLLVLLGSHLILHVSSVRVNGHFNPLNAELNPICHLLA